MAQISDGQLFWIIKNGSAGTLMPEFIDLSDKSIWQLIIYIREFSNLLSKEKVSHETTQLTFNNFIDYWSPIAN